MDPSYTKWVFHGEPPSLSSKPENVRKSSETFRMYRDASVIQVREEVKELRQAVTNLASYVLRMAQNLDKGASVGVNNSTNVLNSTQNNQVSQMCFLAALLIYTSIDKQYVHTHTHMKSSGS